MNAFDTNERGAEFLRIYKGKWKLIIPVVIICTASAFISSMFLTKRYVARASFFIPYDVSIDKIMENNQLGYDVEADRVLQIIGSEQVKDSVVRKFGLIKYFGVDTASKDWPQRMADTYHSRVIATRTNVMSIVVSAETKDPLFSAQIVEYVVRVSERIREKMYKTNTAIAENVFRKEFLAKKQEVDSLESLIDSLRKGNGGNYPLLTNAIITTGTTTGTSRLEALTQDFINENKRLNEVKIRFEDARDLNARPVSRFMTIDNGYPVFDPSYPNVPFLVWLGFSGSLFFMMAAFYLRHMLRH